MIIPQYILDLYDTTTTDFNNSNFGVNCKLFYGTSKTICSNCVFNEALGVSTNIYLTGGPIPFNEGVCPFCFGNGFKESQASEIIKLRVYFDRKAFVKIEVPINVVDGVIQTIGSIETMNKCKRCNYMIVNSDLEIYNEYKFILASDLYPFGLTKKECIAYWNRTQ